VNFWNAYVSGLGAIGGQGFKKTANGTLIYEAHVIYKGVLYFQNSLRFYCTRTNFTKPTKFTKEFFTSKIP